MKTFALASIILIYLVGCFYFNELVSLSCTHGNCVHGWYSKYNKDEKAIASLWILGYPAGSLLIYFSARRKITQKKKRENLYQSAHHHKEPSAIVKVAILNDKSLEFDYTDQVNNKTHRKIRPLNVEDKWGTECIHAWCYLRNDRRTFVIGRMSNIEILD